MNLQKAVEVLKLLRKSIKQGGELPTIFKEHTKAIDTVVEELETRDKSSQVAYTAKDIQLFWRWAYCNGWYYGELEEMWFNDDDNERFTIEDVLKLWETTE